jgi:integrase
MTAQNLLTTKEKQMVGIYKRGTKLYLQFTVDGKRIQKSTGLQDTPQNRKLLKKDVIPKLEAQIISGGYSRQKNKPKTFEYYANIYLRSKENIKTYKELENIVINQLFKFFKNLSVKDIKRADIKNFADTKLNLVSPKRVRTLINIVSAILDVAIDYEEIISNPALNIKLPKHIRKEDEPFSKEEVKLLLNAAEGWFKIFLMTAFYTGARLGELIALTWNDISLEDGFISINKRIKKGSIDTPKTKSSIRKVPILEPLKPYLKMQMQTATSINVFVNPNTKNRFYGTEKLTQYWKETLLKANLDYKILYNTRHTFITNMLESGFYSLLEIAQIVGHSNSDMIIKNYAKYIKGEHLKINTNFNPFADNLADTML